MDAQKKANHSVTVIRGLQPDRDERLYWTRVTQAAVKLELQAPPLLHCHKIQSRYFDGNAQPEHDSNAEDFYRQIYFETVDSETNCILKHFIQNDDSM